MTAITNAFASPCYQKRGAEIVWFYIIVRSISETFQKLFKLNTYENTSTYF
jgi:hypothetical protein